MAHMITVQTKKNLLEELNTLKSEKRSEIAEKIKEARSFGDLSENSEYDEAKNEQAKIEARINEIENILAVSEIIDDDSLKTDKVQVGLTVKLLDIKYDEELSYTIVGSSEADPSNNKISDSSPIGKMLIGKKKNDIVSVNTPDGACEFKILKISK